MERNISVIITGATGRAGPGVLLACSRHPGVEKVAVITRGRTGNKALKPLETVHEDLLDYSEIGDRLAGFDACFWCLGVSQSKLKKEANYSRITYEYTMEAAKVLEKVNPGMTFCFLSGLGTNVESRMMWARTKGKAEKDLGNFDLKVYNFRPGLVHPIKGHKSSTLMGSILYPFIRRSGKYWVGADGLGMTMINVALYGSEKSILGNRDIGESAEKRWTVINHQMENNMGYRMFTGFFEG